MPVTATPVPADVVSISKAEYTASKSQLQIEAASTNASATLQAYVTSTGARIGTLQNNGRGRYTLQLSWPTNPQNVAIRSNFGGSASRAVSSK